MRSFIIGNESLEFLDTTYIYKKLVGKGHMTRPEGRKYGINLFN